ncbi:uncharacterized protein LOC107757724 [Sinocyclocheilus rhinocerous]|uniref:uncharacterized protein LOC107757724 n=1 Tax=Sinocyclocheilus rhinocerous TaxID=307959 RepID=UPI0007B9111D|nr:PREDICTED: uncharacterized protein LOC107757724 [Sinocyclocheilus rhinocerous]
MFFPGKVKVVLRKGPLGYLLQEPTDEASLIKSNPSLQDKAAPMKQDLVRQNALTVVRQRGGDATDKREVLGEYILQFGKYKGKSFRWLLENDMGYTIYLMKTLQQEEAAPEFKAEGHSKHSLVSFVIYAHSFEEIESLLSYVSTTPAAPAASSEDDQLVGFGARAKSTWQEIWKSRADGYASFVLGATCVPGTQMHRLQQYLRKQQQSTCRPVPTSSAITQPISHLLFSRKYCHCINSYKQITQLMILLIHYASMDEDVELESALLSIIPSKLQVQCNTIDSSTIDTSRVCRTLTLEECGKSKDLSSSATTTYSLQQTAEASHGTLPPSESSSSPHTPEPPHSGPSVVVPPLTLRSSPHTPETPHTGPSVFVAPPAQRPDQDISTWTCSYHQKVWMKTELQSLGLWPGSHHMLKPGNALSLWRLPPQPELIDTVLALPSRNFFQLHPFFIWKPESDVMVRLRNNYILPCLHGCPKPDIVSAGVGRPRVIVGTSGQYYIFASRLRCRMCKRIWFADSPQWTGKLPKRFTSILPAFLTYKKAICKSVLHELRRTGKSPSDMANQVNELMHLKYEQAHLAYLHSIQNIWDAEAGVYGQMTLGHLVRKDDMPQSFGAYEDADGWCGVSVSAHYLTDCLIDEYRRQEPAITKLLQGTFGQVLRSDHTRKVARKEFSDSWLLAPVLINEAVSQVVSRDRDATPPICILIGSKRLWHVILPHKVTKSHLPINPSLSIPDVLYAVKVTCQYASAHEAQTCKWPSRTLPPSESSSSPHTPEPPHTGPSVVVASPAQRPDQDISTWTCSYHQTEWMKTELQSLGLWPGCHHMLKLGNALSLCRLPPQPELIDTVLALPSRNFFQLHPFFIWKPESDVMVRLRNNYILPCLHGCPKPDIVSAGVGRPRVIVGTSGQYYIFASRLRCRMCKRIWFADSPQWTGKLPKRFTSILPAFLTYKKAICKSVLHELRRTGKSPSDMANQVNELMHLKYEQAHLAYLHSIQNIWDAEAGVYGQMTLGHLVRKDDMPQSFGAYEDADGWCGVSVSAHYLTDCLIDEYRRQEPAITKLLQGTFGQVLRSDHTRKVARKLVRFVILISSSYLFRDCCAPFRIPELHHGEHLDWDAWSTTQSIIAEATAGPLENTCASRTQYNPNIVVKLDLFHCMRRFTRECTSEHHPLYSTFCQLLSTAFSVVDQEDLQKLKDAYQFCGIQPPNPTKQHIREHCRTKIPQPTELVDRVEKVLRHFHLTTDPNNLPLFKPSMLKTWRIQRVHILRGCLSDPEVTEGILYRPRA